MPKTDINSKKSSDNLAPASGRFVLRLDPALHAALRAAAACEGVSLNDYCAMRLAAPLGHPAARAGAVAVVRQAARCTGAALIGVVVFGSWSRGEAAPGSDVDVLIVVDGSLPVSRALYRRWDADSVAWDGHAVEPHFVHLPAPDRRVAGLWGEVAIDGIVLFERGHRVSRRLAAVRRDIATGKVKRREVHGQGYWADVA